MTPSPAYASAGRPPAPRQEAFAAAERHSRRVRVLRVAVPALASALATGFVAGIIVDPRTTLTSSERAADIDVAGAAIRMERPRLTGYNSERRAYEVTAERAEQSIDSPKRISLVDLTARVQFGEAGSGLLSAAFGLFDSEAQTLRLERGVRVETTGGDRAEMDEADLDLKAGAIASDLPVRLKFGNARLAADSMRILDNGDRLVFEGRVVMTLERRPEAAADGRALPGVAEASP